MNVNGASRSSRWPRFEAGIHSLNAYFDLLESVPHAPSRMDAIAILSDTSHNLPLILLQRQGYDSATIFCEIEDLRRCLPAEPLQLLESVVSPFIHLRKSEMPGGCRLLAVRCHKLLNRTEFGRDGSRLNSFVSHVESRDYLQGIYELIVTLRNEWIGDASGFIWGSGGTRLQNPTIPVIRELALWGQVGRVM